MAKGHWRNWNELTCKVCGYSPGYMKYMGKKELRAWEIPDKKDYNGFGLVYGICPKCKEVQNGTGNHTA